MKLFAPQIYEMNKRALTPVVKHSACLHRTTLFFNAAPYLLLGRALDIIADRPWQFLIAGERDAEELLACYAAWDFLAWPAYNKARGMVESARKINKRAIL